MSRREVEGKRGLPVVVEVVRMVGDFGEVSYWFKRLQNPFRDVLRNV